MLFRKAALIALLLLVLIALGAGVWFWSSQTRLYSNPEALRTNDIYLRAHAPPTNISNLPTNILSAITVNQTTNETQISIPGPSLWTEVDYPPLEIHKTTASEPILIGDGSVRLAYIASAWTIPRTNFPWSIELPAKLFTSDLDPASSNEVTDLISSSDRKLWFKGEFPAARFFFVCSNLPSFKPLKIQAFDARTGHPVLGSSYSMPARENLFWIDIDIRLWHQTPVELVTTIVTGPEQTFTLPPTPGAELRYPGGLIRLLAVSDTDFNSSSSSSDGRTNVFTFSGSSSDSDNNDPRCSFIFYSWPNARLQGELGFYDKKGKMRGYGGSSSENIIEASVFGRTNDVVEIRLRYLPNAHRLVVTLPELPGLPEQNRNLKNLFDLHVPYMRSRYDHDYQRNIAQLLQMQKSHLPLTYSNAFFPVIHTNTTARALFNEMASMLSNKDHQLVADPVANKIESRPNPIITLIQKLKKKFAL